MSDLEHHEYPLLNELQLSSEGSDSGLSSKLSLILESEADVWATADDWTAAMTNQLSDEALNAWAHRRAIRSAED